MIIQMLSNMSSGRHDGRPWPAAWTDFEVPDWEGEDLVNGGNAIKVSDSAEQQEDPAAPLEDLKEAAVEYAESEAVTEPEPEPEAEVDPLADPVVTEGGPPKPAASKQEWIDYAVSQGAEWIAATNSTKQQLMETYGQRP